MKTLIIAEKPSVATDLARVLGKVPKQGDHFENEELVISSAVGHLVELCMPEDYSKQLGSWSLNNLPILPPEFKLKPIKKNEDRYKHLKKLLSRKDIGLVVNGCDAGREGELIFTYLYEMAGCDKPVRRLWMSSMTPDAIRKAYEHMREGRQMEPLRDAARCRSEADWLIGINGTRGATIRMGGRRGGAATSIGRVQTPTLAMIVERELEIRNFVPRTYWRIEGQFQITQGDYPGVYQRADFKKNETDPHDRIDRLWEKEEAEAILRAVQASPQATVTEEKKRTRQSSGRLYDLTSLQREANGRFGMSAGRTLSIAQSLYERHKMITYPRTDSRALPEDYGSNVASALRNFDGELGKHAGKVIENRWINPGNKRIFNNKQVSDHFAIIPTDQKSKKLNDDEAKIFDMIARRFIAVFYPPAEFDVTTRLSEVAGHGFKTEGKVLVKPGYLEVYGKVTSEDILPPLDAADGNPASGKLLSAELVEEETKPPPRYTEATLLSAMEGAGKLVEDEELAEAMKEKGLGTPATRAQTIEHLIYAKYIERQGRELVPLTKAESLLKFLKAFGLEEVSSPTLTGEWEYKLHQIEDGHYSREEFMAEIQAMTKKIVSRITEGEAPRSETSITSFTDGKPLEEDFRGYYSKDSITAAGREYPRLVIYKTIGNRKMSEAEIKELLEKREIGPLDGFRSKAGKAYSAVLKLAEKENGTHRVEFVFDNEGGADGEVDLSQAPVIGKCPLCGGNVHEATQAYICEHQGKGKDACSFRLSRNMLGKAVESAQVKKLLEEGKTDLIKGFRSNRTKRLFDAFLVKDPKRGWGFEFPPRPAKKKGAKKKAAPKKKA